MSDIAPSPVLSLSVILDIVNCSDHLPISLSLNNSILDVMNKPIVITSHNASTSKPIEPSWRPTRMNFHWSKANTVGYYECSRTELFNLHLLLSCNSLADLEC